MANCRERPSHDEGPDTRDAREYRPRPAIRRGRQGHGRARPRAREAWDALSLPQLTAGPRGDPLAGKTREGPDHAGFPGGRRPRGDLTRAVFGVVSERTPAKARLHLPYVPGRLVPVSAHGYGSQPDLAGTSSRGGRPTECFAASGSRAGTSPGGPAPPREASAELVVHGRRRGLSDTGPTTEGPVVDTLLPDGADKTSYLLDAMLGDCTIAISHARGNDRGALYEKEPKTSSPARTIPLVARILQASRAMRAEHRRQMAEFGLAGDPFALGPGAREPPLTTHHAPARSCDLLQGERPFLHVPRPAPHPRDHDDRRRPGPCAPQ